MTDLKHQTAPQRRHYTYMMDVMRRLEWPPNAIEKNRYFQRFFHQPLSGP
ncbi:MAG: hypothetical protein ACOH2H_25610 [Cypionkella sp.]